MDDLDAMTDPEFDRAMAECGLDDPAYVLRVAALIDQARIRGLIPDVVVPFLDPQRALDLFYGRVRVICDKEEVWKHL